MGAGDTVSDLLLSLYHRLPAAARSAVATARGLYLQSWRYGPDTPRLVDEALAREAWSADQWHRWQEERLAFVLHRAATQVPYYRAQWQARRRRGDRASWEMLEHWPVLEKSSLRDTPHAFLADDCRPGAMWRVQTSGTTGTSLTVWRSRTTERALYALAAARRRHWYGVSLAHRSAIVGGQLVTPARQRRPPFWVWNAAHHQLYMSSYHLSPAFIPSYLDALARYGVAYLEGYTSSLYALAQEALRLGRRDLRVIVAVPNAEPVFDYQRRAIGDAFGCAVRETYGMAEGVAAAGECHAGRLHLWPEVGAVEVLDIGAPVPAGGVGDLVCTGLLNADMPLVRYRVGDRGALGPDRPCGCGRTLPVLAAIEGRADDVLVTPDGRRIGRLDPVFKADLPIREAQIIQEALNRVRVRYVPRPGFTPADGRTLVMRLQARLGAVDVVLEELAEVPRTTNGKFRAVVSTLARTP